MLLWLPFDVFAEICSYISVMDLVVLRSSCSTLRKLLSSGKSQQAVWMPRIVGSKTMSFDGCELRTPEDRVLSHHRAGEFFKTFHGLEQMQHCKVGSTARCECARVLRKHCSKGDLEISDGFVSTSSTCDFDWRWFTLAVVPAIYPTACYGVCIQFQSKNEPVHLGLVQGCVRSYISAYGKPGRHSCSDQQKFSEFQTPQYHFTEGQQWTVGFRTPRILDLTIWIIMDFRMDKWTIRWKHPSRENEICSYVHNLPVFRTFFLEIPWFLCISLKGKQTARIVDSFVY